MGLDKSYIFAATASTPAAAAGGRRPQRINSLIMEEEEEEGDGEGDTRQEAEGHPGVEEDGILDLELEPSMGDEEEQTPIVGGKVLMMLESGAAGTTSTSQPSSLEPEEDQDEGGGGEGDGFDKENSSILAASSPIPSIGKNGGGFLSHEAGLFKIDLELGMTWA